MNPDHGSTDGLNPSDDDLTSDDEPDETGNSRPSTPPTSVGSARRSRLTSKSVSWLSKVMTYKHTQLPRATGDESAGYSYESGPADGCWASIVATLHAIFFSSKSNVLLVAFPIGVSTFLCHAHPAVVFTFNAIAIIPLSGLLTFATESVSADLGDTVGALLNISFGNLVELIIFLVALTNNHIRVVQAALLGSVLVNLLLILGSAILAGCIHRRELKHGLDQSQALAGLLCISVFSLLVPTGFYASFKDTEKADRAILVLSRVSALTLLGVYLLYIFYSLRTKQQSLAQLELGHPPSVEPPRDTFRGRRHIRNSSRSALARMIRFADEPYPRRAASRSSAAPQETIKLNSMDVAGHELPHGHDRPSTDEPPGSSRAREMTERPTRFFRGNGYAPLPAQGEVLQSADPKLEASTTASQLREDSPPSPGGSDSDSSSSDESTVPTLSRMVSVILLVISSALIAVSAEFLVDTIDGMVENTPLNHAFIGLIILPIAGNFAEHITAMTVAFKGKMDLALGVSIGSSIQISLFITPIVVLIGWALQRDMTLMYTPFETITLVSSTLLVNVLLLNGRTNILGGGMLVGCYIIVMVGAYLYPE